MTPRPNKPMTIRQFADLCGVSKSTASLAFKSPDQCPLAVKTREAILKTASDVNYRPNWHGRALSTRQSGAIGLVYAGNSPYMSNYYGMLVSELMNRLASKGFDLMHIKAGTGGEALQKKLAERRIDGCFFIAYRAELIKLVDTRTVPSILINGSPYPHASCVHIDDVRAAREATAYLIGRGHRRITFYNDLLRDTGHCSVAERLEGYRQAMREAGLSDFIKTVVAEQDEYADHLLKLGPGNRPTAVLGYDDVRVMDLMLELWSRGMVLPRDLSLMGFNDEISSKYMIPPLTTMGFPVAEVAAAGANAMLRRIAETVSGEADVVTIPMTLVERHSVAAPASS